MTYFLGRDVDVYVTLEATTAATAVGLEADVQGTTIPVCALVTSGATGPDTNIFANTMQSDDTVLASRVHDLTGVDLSISTSDEEVGPFMGQVSTQSVELRKDMTVTLTHKKSDELWDAIYNGPSNGLEFEGRETDATGDTNSNTTLDGLTSTADYRVGMFVVGTGIPKGAIIAAIVDANTVTLSIAATATATVPVSFLDLPAYLHQGARFGVMYTGSTPLLSISTSPCSRNFFKASPWFIA